MSEETLQIAGETREASNRERERDTQLNAEFQRIARKGKKCKKNRGKWERLEIFSRKLGIPKEPSCKDGHNKGQKYQGHNRIREIKEQWQEYTELY